MLINLDKTKKNDFKYDICIVGSGIAGSIISKEILDYNKDIKVAIIERGNFKRKDFNGTFLKDLNFKNLNIKKNSREFILGGSSSTWGGVSTHYTDSEIKKNNIRNLSWPIDYRELIEYYRKSSNKYSFFNTLDYKESGLDLFPDLEKRFFFSNYPPLNFKKFINLFHHDLIFNAHVISIGQVDNTIDYIVAINNNKENVKIFSRFFIFSCGTLETIKLLLNNLKKNNLNLGEEKKCIGSYFMNHPKCISGKIKLFKKNKKIKKFIPYRNNVGSGYWGLSLGSNHKNYLNSYVRFSYDKPKIYINFLKPFLKKIIQFIFNPFKNKNFNIYSNILPNQLLDKNYREYSKISKDKNIGKNNKLILDDSQKGFISFIRRLLFKNYLKVHNYIEMKPIKENRVYLNSRKDFYGNNLLTVDYKISKEEIKTLNFLHKKIKDYLYKENLGILKTFNFENLPSEIYNDSSHHLGGLIMGDSSLDSVVDNNLKVHSLNNLYLISGGVFPTSGSGNPSWTIGALSMRLADNIIKKFYSL